MTTRHVFGKAIVVDGVERPTANSEGQPIHPTREGIVNFWRWFAGSKVVDKHGRPLVVYHAGTIDPKEDIARGAMHFGTKKAAEDRAAALPGSLLIDDLSRDIWYGEHEDIWWVGDFGPYDTRDDAVDWIIDQAHSANDIPEDVVPIHTFYLRIKSPKQTDDASLGAPKVRDEDYDPDEDPWEEIIEWLPAKYDGIKYRNAFEDPGSTSWVALGPRQIKSATFNSGAFSSEAYEMSNPPKHYPVMSYAAAAKWEPEAKRRGVSKVARSQRGFMRAYQRAGSWSRLPDAWKRKRNAFVARHMAQGKKEALWKDGKPSRRALALIMWAYMPPGRRAAKSPRRNPGGGRQLVQLGKVVGATVVDPKTGREKAVRLNGYTLASTANGRGLELIKVRGKGGSVSPHIAQKHREFHGADPSSSVTGDDGKPFGKLREVGLLKAITYRATGIRSPGKKQHSWRHVFGDTGHEGREEQPPSKFPLLLTDGKHHVIKRRRGNGFYVGVYPDGYAYIIG